MNAATMVTVIALACSSAFGQPAPGTPPRHSSAGDIQVSAGMGVTYLSPKDVVDLVNASSMQAERAPEFKSGVEFFGAVGVPLSDDWTVKGEYAYMLISYNVNKAFGAAEYSVAAHLPTIILQYVLVDEGVYNAKAGVGAGLHFGSLSEKSPGVDATYTGKGPGFVVDLEGNTAFGESFFGYLGVNIRWDFIGDVKNSAGTSPPSVAGTTTSLNYFSVGARFGFTIYL
jgi:hypothetical protein